MDMMYAARHLTPAVGCRSASTLIFCSCMRPKHDHIPHVLPTNFTPNAMQKVVVCKTTVASDGTGLDMNIFHKATQPPDLSSKHN